MSNVITYGKSGRLVEVMLEDETGEMRAIIYGDQIKRHVRLLKQSTLVRLEAYTVKHASRIEKITDHKFEIVLGHSTRVERQASSNLNETVTTAKICDIKFKKLNQKINVLGILFKKSERIVIKNRVVTNIHIFDQSLCAVKCELWGDLVDYYFFSKLSFVYEKNYNFLRLIKSNQKMRKTKSF